MEEILNSIALDPNLVYLAVLAGLWMSVTAAYIPGTGIAELIALVLVGGGLLVLVSMPTNWAAVVVLLSGTLMFAILPFTGEKYSQYADFGLVLQAAGGYFMFEGQPVSPLLIGITVLLGFAYNRLMLVPALRGQRSSVKEETLIGQRGRVVKALDPIGTVYVDKELWRARSDEPLPRDMPVVVVYQDGLELVVEKAKREEVTVYENNSFSG